MLNSSNVFDKIPPSKRLVLGNFPCLPSSPTILSYLLQYSVLLTFMAAKMLSDERQIGPRLEKEIEMYCSNKALESSLGPDATMDSMAEGC